MEKFKGHVEVSGITQKGFSRQNNEDNFQIGPYYKKSSSDDTAQYTYSTESGARYIILSAIDGGRISWRNSSTLHCGGILFQLYEIKGPSNRRRSIYIDADILSVSKQPHCEESVVHIRSSGRVLYH